MVKTENDGLPNCGHLTEGWLDRDGPGAGALGGAGYGFAMCPMGGGRLAGFRATRFPYFWTAIPGYLHCTCIMDHRYPAVDLWWLCHARALLEDVSVGGLDDLG